MPGTAGPVYAFSVFKVIQPAGEWASSPEERRAESAASLGYRRSIFLSIQKVWVEEKRSMLLSLGGPTGSGGGRCRRILTCQSSSVAAMMDFRYSRAFICSFSRRGDATRKPKSRMTSGACRGRICSRVKPGME